MVEIPQSPPSFQELSKEIFSKSPERLREIFSARVPADPNGTYYHWDKLRHLKTPTGKLDHREWWFAVKSARQYLYQTLPHNAKDGTPFVFAEPNIARRLLHEIDIHGGGQDLKFPHHENELAQSLCAHNGAPLARFWLHNGFLDVEQEKMSKSIGNVLLPHDLIKTVPGEAIRYALLSAHYTKPLNWTSSGLVRAKQALDRLYRTLSTLPGPNEPAADAAPPDGVRKALLDDVNTPKAQAALFELMRQANSSDNEGERAALKQQMLAAGQLLGLFQQDPEIWLQSAGQDADIDRDEIERLLEMRRLAREAKDFETADQIRDQLEAEGVVLEDSPDGTRWRLG